METTQMKNNSLFKKTGGMICVIFMVLTIGASNVWAADKPVELKFAVLEGTKAARTIYGHQNWADAVEKAANGSIKVSLFPSGSLVSPKQAYDATVNGLADISYISIGHYPGRFPLTESLGFPGNGISNPHMATEIIMEMYSKYPQMQKEFSAVKVLFLFGHAPISIATVSKPIHSWNDLNGLRLRINHKESASYLKSAGVAPAFIPPPDIFLNLQKGIIDGSVMGWLGHNAFGTIKLAKYFTIVPSVPGPLFAYVMNKKKFENLSQDQQTAIMSVSGDAGAQLLADCGDKEIETALNVVKQDASKQIFELSEQEQELWAQKAVGVQEQIIEKMEKKGYPMRQFIQDVKDLVKSKRKMK